jgi:hypothetical protein
MAFAFRTKIPPTKMSLRGDKRINAILIKYKLQIEENVIQFLSN